MFSGLAQSAARRTPKAEDSSRYAAEQAEVVVPSGKVLAGNYHQHSMRGNGPGVNLHGISQHSKFIQCWMEFSSCSLKCKVIKALQKLTDV